MITDVADRLGRLGYGAACLGNLYHAITDEQSDAIVDAAWAGGIRSFDTAPHYGLGLSERRLGAALQTRPRSEFVLSTKVGRLLRPSPEHADRDDDQGFVVPAAYERVWDPSPAGVLRSLDESRERLGLERVDIAYLHDPERYDLDAGLGQALPELARLREAGDLSAIGVGSTSASTLCAAVRTGMCDVIMLAGRLTLLDRTALAELVGLCAQHAVAIVAVGVFNSGALAAPEPRPGLYFDYEPISPERLSQLERIHEVCARFGTRVIDAALQYPLQLPEVVNVTIGAASPDQINASVRGMQTVIDPELWAELA